MIADEHQQRALALMEGGRNVFLTGLAGTGKSFVVGEFIGRAHRGCDITATTGIAAINLQDGFFARSGVPIRTSTVYRWAGVGIGPKPGQSDESFWEEINNQMYPSRQAAFNRIERCHTLLIDEISMLPGRMLDYLNFHCKRIRGNSDPFGGIQLIVVGDFLQLPPVSKTGTYDWAFRSDAWGEAGFRVCSLAKIHRQDEPEFIAALNDFREGRVRGETAAILKRRIAQFPCRNLTRLFTHNTQVNKWNSYSLGCIEGEQEHQLLAVEEGPQHEVDYLKKNMITPSDLRVKVGARVMVTRNLAEGNELLAANGATGTVRGVMPKSEYIEVDLDGGKSITIRPHEFHFDLLRPDSGKVRQYPLRLAYAMTIHKSQGLSLDSALIDIRAAREPGQAYVALSRLRSLRGLWLKDWFKGVFVSDEAIEFYREINGGTTL